MDPTIVVALIGAVATIGAALIGRRSGTKKEKERARHAVADAPRRYAEHLENLISAGVRGGETDAVTHARAIVSVRNDVRNSMIKIAERLNSEIDLLQEQTKDGASPAVLVQTMRVLSMKWPAKRDEIEIEFRKLLAELDILGDAPTYSPHDREEPPRAPVQVNPAPLPPRRPSGGTPPPAGLAQ